MNQEKPKIRWNITEDIGFFGDEWDNWNHIEDDERFEYFKSVFTYFKSIEDSLSQLKEFMSKSRDSNDDYTVEIVEGQSDIDSFNLGILSGKQKNNCRNF